jgi:acyl-CoA thioesterase-1
MVSSVLEVRLMPFKTLIGFLLVSYLRLTFFNLRSTDMNRTLIIKIILLCLVSIKAFALEKVLLLGDSLMAGYGLPNEQHLSVVLENDLQQDGHNIKIINGSVSGSTSSGGLNRVDWAIGEPGLDLVILGLGANDMLRGINPNETEKNLEQIIQTVKDKEIKIILAGMLAPITHGIQYKNQFDQIYPRLAKKYDIPLIPFLLDGVALKPEYNQSDGMHPNDKGTLIISQTLKKSILAIK